MSIAAATVTGPGWTDIMIAFGTVGAVIAAVGIALWAEWRSGRRLKAERDRSDRMLAEERHRSSAALEEERRLAREREQFAQASAVRVDLGTKRGPGDSPGHTTSRRLAAFVENGGSYPIRDVDVMFCLTLDGPLEKPEESERILASPDAVKLRNGFSISEGKLIVQEVLTPWDVGIRFESDVIPAGKLVQPYVVARWTDRWGTMWEHARGRLRQVTYDDPWDDW